MPDKERTIGTIVGEELWSKWVWIGDASMYLAIKGLDNKSKMKFEEMGGYVLMGTLGRAVVEYARDMDAFDGIDTKTREAFIGVVKPLVGALLAGIGAMVMPRYYRGSPFEVFKEGSLIYLVSDGFSLKFEGWLQAKEKKKK
jgi:hypothetical protein